MTSHSEERVVKVCRKCGQQKSLNDFNAEPSMADGHRNQCIECQKTYNKNYRAQNPEKIRNYTYIRKPIPKAESQRRWRESKKGRECCLKYGARYRKANVEKVAAGRLVRNAVRNGELQKEPCARCGTTCLVQAHHDNYNYPLCVTWLCAQHHIDLHRLRRKCWFQLELSL